MYQLFLYNHSKTFQNSIKIFFKEKSSSEWFTRSKNYNQAEQSVKTVSEYLKEAEFELDQNIIYFITV